MTGDHVIEVRNLTKAYQIQGTQSQARYRMLREEIVGAVRAVFRRKPAGETFWALRDVSFDVPRGEVLGIVGSNGAGKSTLLKILSRITEPTSGYAEIRGRVNSLLEVGTGFHPELTGRENVFLNGAILGMKRAEIRRKFDEIVAFSEIDRFLDTPVKHYSSGMYVRLAFAVAAHLEPEVLIVDEVLAVGDARFQKKCLGKIQDVATAGRTVLFVSHNLQAVRRLCSSAVLLKEGGVIAQGRPEAVLSTYLVEEIRSPAEMVQAADPARAARLRRVAAVGSDRVPRAEFAAGASIALQLDFDLNEASERTVAWAYLRTADEVIALATNEYDADPKALERRGPGRFRAEIPLPPVLNAGTYTVVAGVTQFEPDVHLDRMEGVQFTVVDAQRELPEWNQRAGVFKPVIPWSVTPRRDNEEGAHT
jgi:lipopolysaccharide transport system ATP-binding protein